MEEKRTIHINVLRCAKLLWLDKRNVCAYSLVVGIVGVLLSFGTPKRYKSTVILAPEESGNGFSGSISSIASLVGMDLKIGKTGDALYPEIYPEMMKSSEFIVKLFPVKVITKQSNEQYTYQEYIQNHQNTAIYEYPLKIWGNIMKALNSDDEDTSGQHCPDPYNLTKEEDRIVSIILKKVSCTVDKKTSLITIVVEDQDPKVAATIADSVQVHLQHAITDYRTKKSRNDLEYIQKLHDDAYMQYRKARQKYASFADANNEVLLKSVQSVIDELENDLQLKYNIYEHVVEQLQLAKAKVQERTPAFTIVQGARIPVRHSNLPKTLILLLGMAMGFVLRCGIMAYKNRRPLFTVLAE